MNVRPERHQMLRSISVEDDYVTSDEERGSDSTDEEAKFMPSASYCVTSTDNVKYYVSNSFKKPVEPQDFVVPGDVVIGSAKGNWIQVEDGNWLPKMSPTRETLLSRLNVAMSPDLTTESLKSPTVITLDDFNNKYQKFGKLDIATDTTSTNFMMVDALMASSEHDDTESPLKKQKIGDGSQSAPSKSSLNKYTPFESKDVRDYSQSSKISPISTHRMIFCIGNGDDNCSCSRYNENIFRPSLCSDCQHPKNSHKTKADEEVQNMASMSDNILLQSANKLKQRLLQFKTRFKKEHGRDPVMSELTEHESVRRIYHEFDRIREETRRRGIQSVDSLDLAHGPPPCPPSGSSTSQRSCMYITPSEPPHPKPPHPKPHSRSNSLPLPSSTSQTSLVKSYKQLRSSHAKRLREHASQTQTKSQQLTTPPQTTRRNVIHDESSNNRLIVTLPGYSTPTVLGVGAPPGWRHPRSAPTLPTAGAGQKRPMGHRKSKTPPPPNRGGKRCSFFGTKYGCSNGKNCSFSHGEPRSHSVPADRADTKQRSISIRSQTPSTHTEERCHFHFSSTTGCMKGVDCRFSHDEKLRFKDKACKFYHSRKGCQSGDKCIYRHEGRPGPRTGAGTDKFRFGQENSPQHTTTRGIFPDVIMRIETQSSVIEEEYENGIIPTPPHKRNHGRPSPIWDAPPIGRLTLPDHTAIMMDYTPSPVPEQEAECGSIPAMIDVQVFDELNANDPKREFEVEFIPVIRDPKTIMDITEGRGGNFSNTYKARWNGRQVVLKVPKEPAGKSEFNEIRLLTKLEPHWNVISILGICFNFYTDETNKNGSVAIVTPLQVGGDLAEFLSRNQGKLGQVEMVNISLGMAKGLSHLHTNNVIHRDISCRNFLLGSNGRVIISDFGLSRQIQNKNEFDEHYYVASRNSPLPWRWCAPETLKDKKSDKKSDMWMFGIALWELVTQSQRPFPQFANHENLLLKMVTEKLKPEVPRNCPPILRRIILDCCELESKSRPTIHEVMSKIVLYGSLVFE